jgi:hypothetical protein
VEANQSTSVVRKQCISPFVHEKTCDAATLNAQRRMRT